MEARDDDDFDEGIYMLKHHHDRNHNAASPELCLTSTESTITANKSDDDLHGPRYDHQNQIQNRQQNDANKSKSKKGDGVTRTLANMLLRGCMCHPDGMVESMIVTQRQRQQQQKLFDGKLRVEEETDSKGSSRTKYSNRSKNAPLAAQQERLQRMIVNHSINTASASSKKNSKSSEFHKKKTKFSSPEKFYVSNAHSFDDAAHILHSRQQKSQYGGYNSTSIGIGDKECREQPVSLENTDSIEVCMMSPVKTVYGYCNANDNSSPERQGNRFPLISINTIKRNVCGGFSSADAFQSNSCTSENRNIQTVMSILSSGADTAKDSALMYDSDPGDLYKSRDRVRKGKTLIPNQNQGVRLANCDSNIFDGKSVVTAGKSIADSITTLSLLRNGKNDFNEFDPTHVVKHIGEFMNKRMSFIWHTLDISETKNADSTTKSKLKPSRDGLTKRVQAWIELGSVLRNQVIHPKLCWIPVETTPKWSRFLLGSKKYKDKNESKTLGSESDSSYSVQSLDLLDVISILEVDEIDRKQYPFAMKKRTLVIATSDQEVYFETASTKETQQTIFSLKLLISHFAAGIVTRNDDTFNQYFNPTNAEVPGEAPFALEAHYEC